MRRAKSSDKLRIKDIVLTGLLLAIGTILHVFIPGFGAGMKPDTIAAMLIVIVLMYRNFKITLIAGIAGGILAALTTTFPGGQLPNIIDKIVTSLVVLAFAYIIAIPLEKLLSKKPVRFLGSKSTLGTYIACGVIGFLGTIVSGLVFLTSALYIVGLPAPFEILFLTVVIPAAIASTIVVMVLYPLVAVSKQLVDRSGGVQVKQ